MVLTIPKRLRVHTRFDRTLLGKLCAAAWTCLRDEIRRLLGRDDVVPGMIGAIQTHGELLHWHPHFHALVTCGAFTAEGEFLEVHESPLDFLAEFTQHIPPKGAHLIRYYGYYSNKARGMRRKAAEAEAATEQAAGSSSGEAPPVAAPSRSSQTWAMLIKRVYELCEAQNYVK